MSDMNVVSVFIAKIEKIVPEGQRVPLMDTTLQSTSARWWSNYCNSLTRWDEVAAVIKARFQMEKEPKGKDRYQGDASPRTHLKECEVKWRADGYLEELWIHRFIHSLDIIPKAWYLTEEKRRGTHN